MVTSAFCFIIFNNRLQSIKKEQLTPPQNLKFYFIRYVNSENRKKKTYGHNIFPPKNDRFNIVVEKLVSL